MRIVFKTLADYSKDKDTKRGWVPTIVEATSIELDTVCVNGHYIDYMFITDASNHDWGIVMSKEEYSDILRDCYGASVLNLLGYYGANIDESDDYAIDANLVDAIRKYIEKSTSND